MHPRTAPFAGTLVVAVLAATLGACDATGPADFDALAAYDSVWAAFDREYSYFGYKGVDWDSLGAAHRPAADGIMTPDALVDVLVGLTAPLRDRHVRFLRNGLVRESWRPDVHENWDKSTWLNEVRARGWVQKEENWGYAWMDAGHDVAYLAFGAWSPDQIEIEEVDAVLDTLRDASALVVDVRVNGGGNDLLGLAVAARFADRSRVVEYVQFRDGPDHDDFTPLMERVLDPRGPWQYTRPMVVLTGRASLSSNETFIAAMGELPHVTLLGDTTGGSTGNPGFHDLVDGWEYSVPRWIAYTADTVAIEWRGIAPDVLVPTTDADFRGATDPVITAAAHWLAAREP